MDAWHYQRGGILLVSYLLGSIPFGLIFTRFFGGGDVRAAGSGNIGATNVARVAGRPAAVLTLLFDAAKGAAAVCLAMRLTPHQTAPAMLAGLLALIGHCFPIWLGFRGGKGAATAAGVYAVLCPAAMAAAILLFVIVVGFRRYVSLGSLAAAAAMPLLVYFLWAPGHAPPLAVETGTLAGSILIIWKHRPNIRRLLAGEEPQFRFGPGGD